MTTLFSIRAQRLIAALALALTAALSNYSFAALSDYQVRLDSVTKNQGFSDQDERLRAFMDLVYDYQMTEYPETATWLGYPGQNNRWTDYSAAAIERRKL
jgi:hypothetical protein